MESHTNVARARNSKNTRKLQNKHQTSKANAAIRGGSNANGTNTTTIALLNKQIKDLNKNLQNAQRTIGRLTKQINRYKSQASANRLKSNYAKAIDLIKNNINSIPR